MFVSYLSGEFEWVFGFESSEFRGEGRVILLERVGRWG